MVAPFLLEVGPDPESNADAGRYCLEKYQSAPKTAKRILTNAGLAAACTAQRVVDLSQRSHVSKERNSNI